MEWTETRVYKATETFITRSARNQARVVMLREIERERDRKKGRYYGRWGTDDASYLKGMDSVYADTKVIGEPLFTESED